MRAQQSWTQADFRHPFPGSRATNRNSSAGGGPFRSPFLQPDESLVLDDRARLRPSQLVEGKLVSVLRSVYVPVSQVGTTRPRRYG
jgi:hypothetical protein